MYTRHFDLLYRITEVVCQNCSGSDYIEVPSKNVFKFQKRSGQHTHQAEKLENDRETTIYFDIPIIDELRVPESSE
jgi:hypothetical protein